jgi:spermidine synthase
VQHHPSITLSNGMIARIEKDRWTETGYTLIVDGTPQSHVYPNDPGSLFFEYVSRMGHVIDVMRTPGQPITAVHLGAGGLTLPRYVEATRPGSRQQVIELERDLVDFVREHLPWSSKASIRVRYGDAREVVGKLPGGLAGTADLLIVDIFGGAQIPRHVTSVEFYTAAIETLAPDGIVLVNIADGPPLTFARAQTATLQAAIGEVAVLAETSVLKGRRYGNLVLVGSRQPLPLTWMPRLLAAGPHPAKVVAGRELRDFIAGAPVTTDETSTPSPPPTRGIFQVRPPAD